MNERILEIADMAAYLSIDRGFLSVSVKNGKKYNVPIDDIGGVIANSYDITYSNNLLVKLAELNIPLVICGTNHSPAGILWPTCSRFNTSGVIDFQIRAKLPLYKRLWQAVIKAKIANQAATLRALNKNYIKVESLIGKVASGDATNIEGFAARVYWRELFGDNFIRDQSAGGINSILNYGYTIMRSGIARAIMGAGLHPSIGIFHKNKSNPMRLADDLMEPFRPITDFTAFILTSKGEENVSATVKRELVNCLYLDMDSSRGRSPVINRMQCLASSFVLSLEKNKVLLDLPDLSYKDLLNE